MEALPSVLITGILVGGIYSLIALPIVVIYKSSKIFNFAQGYMLLLLAWVVWAFSEQMGLPFWLSVILGLAVAAIIGVLVERLALRRLIGQPILSSIIVTLGLGALFGGIVFLFWGNITTECYSGFVAAEAIKLGPATLSFQHLIFFIISLALLAFSS